MANDTFTVERSLTVHAPPERIFRHLADFHAWTAWSPWEDLDPDLQRSYSGPASGVGAGYAWSGNRRAGQGSMQITSSTPEEIGIDLSFLKPWRATNDVRFTLAPDGSVTAVTWRMTGDRGGVMGLLAKVVPMDRMIGRDFERGLARLKALAES